MLLNRTKLEKIALVLVCVILGILIVLQYRATKKIRENISIQRVEDLTQRLMEIKQERDELKKIISKTNRNGGNFALLQELEENKLMAGTIGVTGQGIIINIDDSRNIPKESESANIYVIHDEDILKIVNELKAAGAEAITINEQRMTARTEIRCAGPTISINNTRFGAPFEIKAIGNQKILENSLLMKGGIAEMLKIWGIKIKIIPKDNIYLQPFKGISIFEYVKINDRGDKK